MQIPIIVECHPGEMPPEMSDLGKILACADCADGIMIESHSGLVDYWTHDEDDWSQFAFKRRDGQGVRACRMKDFDSLAEAAGPGILILDDDVYSSEDYEPDKWEALVNKKLDMLKELDTDEDPCWIACLNAQLYSGEKNMSQLNKDRISEATFNGHKAYYFMKQGSTVTDGEYVYAMRTILSPDNVPINYVVSFPDWDDMATGLTPSLEWESDYRDNERFHLYTTGFSAEAAIEKMREGKVLYCKACDFRCYIGRVITPLDENKELVFVEQKSESMIFNNADDFIRMYNDKFFDYKDGSSKPNN